MSKLSNLKMIGVKTLNRVPKLKILTKKVYYRIGALLSDRRNSIPSLVQISSDGVEHNFGYYDKSPWSKDGKYMIYLALANASKTCVLCEPVSIILYDCQKRVERVIAHTHVWNSQQGCMLQWLGPDFSTHIVYNDFRDGRYCSVVHAVESGEERVLPVPVYTVSTDGTTAITLDFSRLNTFRPGYGYCNLIDLTAKERYPNTPCMWRLDIESGVVFPLPITYQSLSQWQPHDSMKKGYHRVNHIMLNPSGNRFMFIHRWVVDGMTYHRLLTCNVDGSDLYDLLDGMVSHNNWKDDETIISYCSSQDDIRGYYILHDKTQKRELLGTGSLMEDGHPSYSPDGRYIVTDTYPNFKCKQSLYVVSCANGRTVELGKVYSSPKYRDNVRCDLHPRWDHDTSKICIDAAPGRFRQVFSIPFDAEKWFKEG